MTSQLFDFDIYAYEIFNAINGRNFHLESFFIFKKIPYNIKKSDR